MGNNSSQLSMKSDGGPQYNGTYLKSDRTSPLITFTIVNTFLVLAFIVLYLCLLFFYLSKDWVDGKNCLAPIGEFSVEPGVDVGNVITGCHDSTYDEKGTCIYNKVPSLLQATRICNQKADICSRFVYNATSQKFKIVSLQGTPNRGSQDDNTYTRQANVTFHTSGSQQPSPPTLDSTGVTITDTGEVVPTTVVSNTATGL
ncbi:MAG: hypothetical protein S4CHLAM20_14650 [Chlamydiia bacterium]|nr:hypothetical protein [Chlamydiia bacterium]